MVIAAATLRRDRLAWQIARATIDRNVRSFEDLSGRRQEVGLRQDADVTAERFRMWRAALKAKFGGEFGGRVEGGP